MVALLVHCHTPPLSAGRGCYPACSAAEWGGGESGPRVNQIPHSVSNDRLMAFLATRSLTLDSAVIPCYS